MKVGIEPIQARAYMSNDRQKWEDDIMKGVKWTKNFLDFLLNERSQLYGTIILLMLSRGLESCTLPPIDEFRELGNKYFAVFEEDENKNYRVTLKEQEKTTSGNPDA